MNLLPLGVLGRALRRTFAVFDRATVDSRTCWFHRTAWPVPPNFAADRPRRAAGRDSVVRILPAAQAKWTAACSLAWLGTGLGMNLRAVRIVQGLTAHRGRVAVPV